eukprot:TRINITY_DN3620_c0_g1_i1.p1 TRINITY_DN3620_c0_g1~~TRINITY_DN3620_c0_g1_i1.p1  ORF type:complete len:563 (+),score=123.37 TRINITY_DN3620_c0_g1_i1:51-1739(+)
MLRLLIFFSLVVGGFAGLVSFLPTSGFLAETSGYRVPAGKYYLCGGYSQGYNGYLGVFPGANISFSLNVTESSNLQRFFAMNDTLLSNSSYEIFPRLSRVQGIVNLTVSIPIDAKAGDKFTIRVLGGSYAVDWWTDGTYENCVDMVTVDPSSCPSPQPGIESVISADISGNNNNTSILLSWNPVWRRKISIVNVSNSCNSLFRNMAIQRSTWYCDQSLTLQFRTLDLWACAQKTETYDAITYDFDLTIKIMDFMADGHLQAFDRNIPFSMRYIKTTSWSVSASLVNDSAASTPVTFTMPWQSIRFDQSSRSFDIYLSSETQGGMTTQLSLYQINFDKVNVSVWQANQTVDPLTGVKRQGWTVHFQVEPAVCDLNLNVGMVWTMPIQAGNYTLRVNMANLCPVVRTKDLTASGNLFSDLGLTLPQGAVRYGVPTYLAVNLTAERTIVASRVDRLEIGSRIVVLNDSMLQVESVSYVRMSSPKNRVVMQLTLSPGNFAESEEVRAWFSVTYAGKKRQDDQDSASVVVKFDIDGNDSSKEEQKMATGGILSVPLGVVLIAFWSLQ